MPSDMFAVCQMVVWVGGEAKGDAMAKVAASQHARGRELRRARGNLEQQPASLCREGLDWTGEIAVV